MVESCHDLILNLDLRGFNLTAIRTVIRDSGTVLLDTILVHYRQSFAQTFNLALYKVKNFTLSGVRLVSAVKVGVETHRTPAHSHYQLVCQISASNVGQMSLTDCSFSLLPQSGLVVSGLAKLSVTSNVFSLIQVTVRLTPALCSHYLINVTQAKSIVVRQTRQLVITDNQFGVSSPNLDLLSYSDSVPHVKILCNRLLGSPPSKACSTDVSPEIRLTTTTARLPVSTQDGRQYDVLVTVTGTLLILAILCYVSYMTYTHRSVIYALKAELLARVEAERQEEQEEEHLSPKEPAVKVVIPPPPPSPPCPPAQPTPASNKTDNGLTQLTDKPRRDTDPVWLQEIKSNELFNKKKKLAEEEEEEADDEYYPHVTVVRNNLVDSNISRKKEYVF